MRAVIQQLSGVYRLVAQLLYGCGFRQIECLRLRVKDIDFAQHQIDVWHTKGMKSRVTMLPDLLVVPLQEHLQSVKRLHTQDLEKGQGAVAFVLGTEPLPDHHYEMVRHLVFGTLTGVRLTIQDLHKKHYAEPNDWSKPISTGRPNEVMVILTKRLAIKARF